MDVERIRDKSRSGNDDYKYRDNTSKPRRYHEHSPDKDKSLKDRDKYRERREGDNFRRDEENKANRVFVGNLSFKTNWQTLKDHMRQAGEVVRANIFLNKENRSKGCG